MIGDWLRARRQRATPTPDPAVVDYDGSPAFAGTRQVWADTFARGGVTAPVPRDAAALAATVLARLANSDTALRAIGLTPYDTLRIAGCRQAISTAVQTADARPRVEHGPWTEVGGGDRCDNCDCPIVWHDEKTGRCTGDFMHCPCLRPIAKTVEQCPNCTSDHRWQRFVMPVTGGTAPCSHPWHGPAAG